MVLTWGTALVVLVIGFFIPSLARIFDVELSGEIRGAFLVSVTLMLVHKIESYFFKEYDRCPVYLGVERSSRAGNVRQTQFVVFVSTFLLMMYVVVLVMSGPPWPLLLITVWLAQGLHEIHHGAKTLVERRYYPGVISSLVFVLHVCLFIFPKWYSEAGLDSPFIYYAYYALVPLVFAAFALEHRKWTKQRKAA